MNWPSLLPSCMWIISLLLLPFPFGEARGQRGDTVPRVRMYGVGDDEFILSGYIAATSPHGIGDLWNFARSMGITTIQPGGSIEQLDSLVDSPFRDPALGRLIVRGLTPIQDAGIGRELTFFPFDSAQSQLYVWKFTRLAGGAPAFNAGMNGAREQVYSTAENTSPGQMVASHVAYDWHPWQVNRFPKRGYDTTAQNASGLIDWYLYRSEANRRAPTFYIVVTGHLFAGGSARPEDSLLRIELRYEVREGERYLDTNNVTRTASSDLDLPYATLLIRKESLRPRAGESWNSYRTISLPVDLYKADGATFGPLHPGNESRRLDMRVYWTGAERVALRSVSIRDSIGELLLGERPSSVAYRESIVRTARRVLYGEGGSGELRRSVIRLMAGIEPHPTEYAGGGAVQEILRSSVRDGLASDQWIPVHSEGGTSEQGLKIFHHLTLSDAIYTEIGLAAAVDTIERYGGDLYKAYMQRCSLRMVQIPSIAEHNGGRFQIPLLRPTSAAIEEEYEPVLQILRYGQYDPGGIAWPWNLGGVTNLAHGSEASRATGRRMIPTLFTTAELHLRIKERGDRLDTLMSHPPEASELRAMANLGIAYGAQGMHYYWLGNYTNHMHRPWQDPAQWAGVNDSWGSNGPSTGDTTLDHADTFNLTDNVPTPQYPQGTPRVKIPGFYVGYGVRTREIKRLNGWLARIGPELMKLRWRDAYSIHHTVRHPNIDPAQVRPRPIPRGEIVRQIVTRSRDGRIDPPHATYVELGLFEPMRPSTSPRDTLADVHHIFVVNRRSFECPDDIDPASTMGRRLDSLAESRMITIRFGLGDSLQWRRNIIRVRELAADTTRLPLANAPRVPLDTFIVADSAVNIRLRPGGGALLEITFPLARLFSEENLGDRRDFRLPIFDFGFDQRIQKKIGEWIDAVAERIVGGRVVAEFDSATSGIVLWTQSNSIRTGSSFVRTGKAIFKT